MDSESISSVLRRNDDSGAVRRLCAVFREIYGVPHAILVDHGSTAIRAGLRAIKLSGTRGGGAIAVPCNVWRGVYAAIGFAGCGPLALLDVDATTGVLAPEKIRREREYDIIVAVDGYGIKASISDIKTNLPGAVLEDASLSQLPSKRSDGGLAADSSSRIGTT
jgi:dTDP-4-amino-4,6-dideoxygalactose transaminase